MLAHRFAPVFSEQLLRSYTEVSVMPSVHAVFEKCESTHQIHHDTISEPSLREYIRRSEALDREMRQSIGRGVNGEPIIVWGVGTTTQRLLATGGLDGVNISAFVDSNPKYQGQTLHGAPILSPDSLTLRTEPILICSEVFRLEIEKQIRELGLRNQVLTLNSRQEVA